MLYMKIVATDTLTFQFTRINYKKDTMNIDGITFSSLPTVAHTNKTSPFINKLPLPGIIRQYGGCTTMGLLFLSNKNHKQTSAYDVVVS